MALSDVNIELANGQLVGAIQFAEGVAGIIGTGVAVAGKIGIADPRLVTSLDDAKAIGITLADNASAYRQVKEFYDEAGTGNLLFVMLCPDTMSQEDMWDNTNDNGIKKLINYARGIIRIAGSYFIAPVGYTLDVTDGIDADAFLAVNNGQVLTEAYAAMQKPLRGIVEGRAFSGVAADLTDLKTLTKNRMAITVASSTDDGVCSVGLALGRLAKIPVQRKISRVKDGALTPAKMYVGSNDVADYGAVSLIHDKGYIVARTFPTKGGYYFGGDHTCAADTDDYCFIGRGRVIDKLQVLAYTVYTNELDDEIVVNVNGTLDIGWIKTMETNINNQVKESMVSTSEISGFTSFIDPAQNVNSTSRTQVVLKPIPVGYNTNIDVKLGWQNPAAA